MKKISTWAKNHKWTARLIMIGSFILLTVLAIVNGLLISGLGIIIPATFFSISIIIYLAACFLYPDKAKRGKNIKPAAFYVWQKSCDLVLAASTFCMILFLGNRPDHLFRYTLSLQAAVTTNLSLPKDSTIKTYKSIDVFAASMKDENGKKLNWKERKKLLKEQIDAIKNSNGTSPGVKIFLITLSVIAALFLLGLVAALSCSLSCNGSEGAAALVLVGGTGLIVFLLMLAIKAISGKKKKKIPNPDQPVKVN